MASRNPRVFSVFFFVANAAAAFSMFPGSMPLSPKSGGGAAPRGSMNVLGRKYGFFFWDG